MRYRYIFTKSILIFLVEKKIDSFDAMQIDVCFGKQKHNSKTIQNLIQTIVRELLQVKTNIMKPRVKILCWTEEI